MRSSDADADADGSRPKSKSDFGVRRPVAWIQE
jgi:hypothetical protein